ncbi:MAG: hypothetical protein ACTSSP_00530 [Candidatus Asgardarchaeia archaeon]
MSVLLSFGLAVTFVEKGKDWPVRPFRIRIQFFLRKIHYKLPQMLFCTTCTSFWGALVADIVICIVSTLLGCPYFFWPFSGFTAMGFTWSMIEFLNAIDKEHDIYIDNNLKEK